MVYATENLANNVQDLHMERLVHHEHVALVSDLGECAIKLSDPAEWARNHIAIVSFQNEEIINLIRVSPTDSSDCDPRLYIYNRRAWDAAEDKGLAPATIIGQGLGKITSITPGGLSVGVDENGYFIRTCKPLPDAITFSIGRDKRVMIDDMTGSGKLVSANWAHSLVIPHMRPRRPIPVQQGLRLLTSESA